MNPLTESLDHLADEVFRCTCSECNEKRQARLSRDLELEYGCNTEFMLMRRKLAGS